MLGFFCSFSISLRKATQYTRLYCTVNLAQPSMCLLLTKYMSTYIIHINILLSYIYSYSYVVYIAHHRNRWTILWVQNNTLVNRRAWKVEKILICTNSSVVGMEKIFSPIFSLHTKFSLPSVCVVCVCVIKSMFRKPDSSS